MDTVIKLRDQGVSPEQGGLYNIIIICSDSLAN